MNKKYLSPILTTMMFIMIGAGLTSCGNDDDNNDSPVDGGLKISDNKLPDKTPKGVTAVDLGLSIRWASCNVGATQPEEYGDYYAWGDLNKRVSEETNPYNIRGNICGTIHDVAYVQWGGEWRLPTSKECNELREKCTYVWTTKNGINGMLITGPNKNTIFLPAAGTFIGGYNDYNHTYYTPNAYEVGECGRYWSGSASTNEVGQRYGFTFDNNFLLLCGWLSPISNGYSIRPVYGKLN